MSAEIMLLHSTYKFAFFFVVFLVCVCVHVQCMYPCRSICVYECGSSCRSQRTTSHVSPFLFPCSRKDLCCFSAEDLAHQLSETQSSLLPVSLKKHWDFKCLYVIYGFWRYKFRSSTLCLRNHLQFLHVHFKTALSFIKCKGFITTYVL